MSGDWVKLPLAGQSRLAPGVLHLLECKGQILDRLDERAISDAGGFAELEQLNLELVEARRQLLVWQAQLGARN